jgi:hypothetical protein
MKGAKNLSRLLDNMEREERATLEAKGADYSDVDGENRLANFERIADRFYIRHRCECGREHKVNLTPRHVLGIYMAKHGDSIDTWINEGALRGEPLAEKLKDLRNYAALARLMEEATGQYLSSVQVSIDDGSGNV